MSRRRSIGSEHIVVVGAMGSGKSSVGQGLAREMGREFIDSDQQIRERTGRDGSAIAGEEGIDALHTMEREVLWDALASDRPLVIAAAASVIEDEEVRHALGELLCVWLRAEPTSLTERQARSGHRRRAGAEEAARMEQRTPLYESCADVTIDTTSLTAEEAVASVLEMLGARDG